MKSKGTKFGKIKTIRKIENTKRSNEPYIQIEEIKPINDDIRSQEA